MANHRLGNSDEGEKWLDQATEYTKKILVDSLAGAQSVPWNRRLTLQLLDAEAKALLGRGAKEEAP